MAGTNESEGVLYPQEPILATVEQEIGQFATFANPRLLPALSLYAYNFFTDNPHTTPEQIRYFRTACLDINRKEEHAARLSNPIVAMGAEMELRISPENREILSRLGIEAIPLQGQEPSSDVYKVISPWTHSADTQVFFLRQLLKLQSKETSPIGLQLVFTLPAYISLTEEDEVKDRVEVLAHSLAISYSSLSSLKQLTRPEYFDIKSDNPPQAHKGLPYTRALRLNVLGYNPDIIDTLAHNTQYLMTGLFLSLNKTPTINNRTTSIKEAFDVFVKDADELQDTYSTGQKFPDAIALLSSPMAQLAIDNYRKLVDQASKTIQELTEPNTSDD